MSSPDTSDTAPDDPSRLRRVVDPLGRHLRERFTVDTRSLAAFRMLLAAIVLIDLLGRARYLELFYTDQGIYTIAAYEATYTQYNGLSVHALSGDLWFQQFLFVIAAVFAVLLLIGFKTRFVGIVSFVLLFSLHARNPAVLNGGDVLFRILFFLSLLVPLGERWSLDALHRGEARSQVCSAGTVALLLQPVVVFTANAVLKHGGEHWYSGDGLEIALLNDSMRFYLGNVIVEYSALMTALNYAWVALVAGSALFLLGTTGRARALAVLVYLGAFLGMLTAMAVGLFPLVLTAAVTPYLTAPFWEALSRPVPDGWQERLPDRARLGPFARPPLKRRLLDRLGEGNSTHLVEFSRSLLTAVGVMAVVWMLLFAGSDVAGRDLPDQIDSPHLQQSWGLYAPDPASGYDWFVTEAELADGRSVTVPDNASVEFDRPPDGSAAFESFRHRKYMSAVEDSAENETHRAVAEAYGEWACRRAAAAHDQPVERVILHELYQQSPLDGTYDEKTRWTLLVHECP